MYCTHSGGIARRVHGRSARNTSHALHGNNDRGTVGGTRQSVATGESGVAGRSCTRIFRRGTQPAVAAAVDPDDRWLRVHLAVHSTPLITLHGGTDNEAEVDAGAGLGHSIFAKL